MVEEKYLSAERAALRIVGIKTFNSIEEAIIMLDILISRVLDDEVEAEELYMAQKKQCERAYQWKEELLSEFSKAYFGGKESVLVFSDVVAKYDLDPHLHMDPGERAEILSVSRKSLVTWLLQSGYEEEAMRVAPQITPSPVEPKSMALRTPEEHFKAALAGMAILLAEKGGPRHRFKNGRPKASVISEDVITVLSRRDYLDKDSCNTREVEGLSNLNESITAAIKSVFPE